MRFLGRFESLKCGSIAGEEKVMVAGCHFDGL
jgi:hypothetical protein